MATHSNDDTELVALATVRKHLPNIKLLDDMLQWWKDYKENDCPNLTLVAKCDRIIIPLEKYRSDFGNMVWTHARHVKDAIKAYRVDGDKFRKAEAISVDSQRKLEQLKDDAGRYVQAFLTKLLLEDTYFDVVGLEVRGSDHDFDVLIADEHGDKYAVEIWFGQNKHGHASREMTAIVGSSMGDYHIYPGTVPKRLEDIASNQGGISMSSKPDLPKIGKKLKQLSDKYVGFLIACRQAASPFDMADTDFPTVSPVSMPMNKCIIVLDMDGAMGFGKYGTGYLIHHPDFDHAHIVIAQKIIQSLGCKYDQERYARKMESRKKFNME